MTPQPQSEFDPLVFSTFRFSRSIRLDRVRLLVGCVRGRHSWIKQRATFGPAKVAPDGQFYETYYCEWCGCGYPAPSLLRDIMDEVLGR